MPELPPVSEDFIGDSSGWVAAVEAMIAATDKAIAKNAELLASMRAVSDYQRAAAAAAAEDAAAQTSLADASRGVAAAEAEKAAATAASVKAQRDEAEAAANAAITNAAAAAAAGKNADADLGLAAAAATVAGGSAKATETFLALGAAEAFAADEAAKMTATAAALRGALGADTAEAAGFTAAMVAAGASTKALTAGAASTAPVLAKMLTLGTLFKGGLWSLTSWHYIIDGAVELGIVLGGATLALTAFGIAGSRTADAILTHFQSLIPVMAATGQTVAPLTSQMDRLSTAMAPNVIQLYGDALGVVNAKTGAFATLVHQSGSVLDYWGARAAMALQRSSTAGMLAAKSSTYLNMVLQFLASTFGVLGNLMRAAMDTHIAEILFGIATGAMRLLGVITSLPTPLLAVAMGIHGLWLWGRFGGAILGSLATRAAGLGVTLIGLAVRFGFVGDAGVAMAGKLGASMQQMTAMSAATKEETGLLAGLANVGKALLVPALLAGAAALVYFAYKQATAQTATDKWETSLQAAVDKASMLNGLNATFGALAKNTAALGQSQRQVTAYFTLQARLARETGTSFNEVNSATWQQITRFATLARAQQKWVDESNIAIARTGYLAGRFGGLTQAIGLASLAGVKWSTILHGSNADWQTAVHQISAMILGYKMMGQSGSAVANDVNAVTFSIEMQDSKVQTLNQAWQTYLGIVTGGESSFLSFEQQMQGLGQAIGGASAKLSDSNGRISLSSTLLGGAAAAAGKTTASFNGLSTASLGVRQTFIQSITSASSYLQAITQMGAAAANGARSEGLITQASKDVVAQLIPVGKTSAWTRAQLFALAQEAGYHGVQSMQALAKWVGPGGVQKHERDLNKVTSALTGQISNLTQDVNRLGAALGINLNAQMAKSVTAASGVEGAMNAFTSDIMNNAGSLAQTQAARNQFYDDMLKMGETPKQATASLETLTEQVMRGRAALLGVHAPASRIVSDLSSIGQHAGLSNRQIATMISTVTGMPKQKILNIMMDLNGKPAGAGAFRAAGVSAATGVSAGINAGAARVDASASRMIHGAVVTIQQARGEAAAAGRDVTSGLIQGLLSREGAAAAAAQQIADVVTAHMRTGLGTASPSKITRRYGLWTVQGLIQGLQDGGPKLAAAIQNITNTILRAFQAGVISSARKSALVAWVQGDNSRLQALAAQRKAIVAKIAAVGATDKALQSSFTSIIGLGHAPAAYSGKVPTAQQMLANLKTELGDIKRFAADLKKLKALGLDNSIIQRIIAMGPMQGTAYAEALIKAAEEQRQIGTGKGKQGGPGTGPPTVGGPGGGTSSIIAQLNAAYEQIQSYSKSAADSVAGQMYGAGVQGAKGLIAGLKSQLKALDALMKHIADTLVKRLKHDLKIKSPSAVMHEHGVMAMQGLANGITAGEPMIVAAMRRVAAIVGGTPMRVPVPSGPVFASGRVPMVTAPGGGSVPLAGGGANPGGPMHLTVHVEVHGHVMTEHQLGDVIREVVLTYAARNSDNGFRRPGRAA